MTSTLSFAATAASNYTPARRRAGADRVTTLLTAAGLASCFAALVLYTETSTAVFPSVDVPKSALYYALHGLQIASLIAAGALALWRTDTRNIERGYLTQFALFLAATALMTLRGYTLSDLLSTKLADVTGPLPCLLSVLLFLGARRANWKLLGSLIVVSSVVFTAATLLAVIRFHGLSREAAVVSIQPYANALLWPASWIVLSEFPRQSWVRIWRPVPVVVYALASVFTATRLNFVMLILLAGVYAYLQRKRGKHQSASWFTAFGICFWVALFAVLFFQNTQAYDRFDGALTAFYNRMDQDTRTNQLERFFEDVKPQELILGRGAMAIWYWGAFPWKGGTDVGYLTCLLYGGVPLLFTFVLVHLVPGFRALFSKRPDWRAPAAGVVVLFAFRMFSSEYMGLSPEHVVLLLCVGACISKEGESVRRGRLVRSRVYSAKVYR